MKKRRELDALVNNKSNGRRKKKGPHEMLLENMSDSSEIEEFSVPGKPVMRRRGFCQFCATCLTVCGFFMLVACISGVVGLIWVHIELKQELEDLKSNLNRVKSGIQDNPEEFDRLHKEIQDLDAKIGLLSNEVKQNITRHGAMLQDSQQKIQANSDALQQGAANVDATDISALQQNQAGFGSQLRTFEQEMHSMKSDTESKLLHLNVQLQAIETSSNGDSDQAVTVDPLLIQRVYNLESSLDAVNTSLTVKILGVAQEGRQNQGQLSSLQQELEELKQSAATSPSTTRPPTSTTEPQGSGKLANIAGFIDVAANLTDLNSRLSVVEQTCADALPSSEFAPFRNIAQTMQNISTVVYSLVPRTASLETEMQNQQVQLQFVNATIATLQSAIKASKPGQSPADASEGVINDGEVAPSEEGGDIDAGTENQDVAETSPENSATYMTSDAINSAEDVAFEFDKWDTDADGYVVYNDVLPFFGPSMLTTEQLSKFDSDSDGKYSLSEMQRAFGFTPAETFPIYLNVDVQNKWRTENFYENNENYIDDTRPTASRPINDQDTFNDHTEIPPQL